MRAYCHKDDGTDGFCQWENLKRGYPVQQRQAQELHREAGPLWLGRALPILTGVGAPIPIIGDDPDETVFSIFN